MKDIAIIIPTFNELENIEKLLQFEEVDGAMVGPYDISGSLGIPGQIAHQKVKDAGQLVVDACRKFRKACGTQDIDPTSESVQVALDSGYTFVVLASDVFILWKWGERMEKVVTGCR